MTALVVATLNIWNDARGRWSERVGLVAAEIVRLQPDIAAFQEVDQTADQLRELADAVGAGGGEAYRHVFRMNNPRPGSIKSLGVLSTQPAAGDPSWLALGHDDIAFRVPFGAFDLVTTHLLYRPGKEGSAIRRGQAESLTDWIGDGDAVVLGDFNSSPDGQATAVMKRSFRSAHEVANGVEPTSTHPTPMSPFAGDARHAAIDYVFVSAKISVVSCSLAFDTPSSDEAGLYPSDHFGLVAVLELP